VAPGLSPSWKILSSDDVEGQETRKTVYDRTKPVLTALKLYF